MQARVILKPQSLEFIVGRRIAKLDLPYKLVDDQRILDRVGLIKFISEWSRVQPFKAQACVLELSPEAMFTKIVSNKDEIAAYWESVPVSVANLAKMVKQTKQGWELRAADRNFFLGVKRALESAGWKVNKMTPWASEVAVKSYQDILLFIQWLALLALLLVLLIKRA